MKIHQLAIEERPREKLIKYGVENLSDQELLAIVLGSGTTKYSVLEISRMILKDNSFKQLKNFHTEEWQKFEGIGHAKAILLKSIFEIHKRSNSDKIIKKIAQPEDAFELLKPKFYNIEQEEFWVIYLNNNNQVIDIVNISRGGLTKTIVDPKIVFKHALKLNANRIILSHNHPSGNLKASRADIQLTDRIKSAGEILSIAVLDHLIIYNDRFVCI